jgi:hypothetical protein
LLLWGALGLALMLAAMGVGLLAVGWQGINY